MNIGDLVILIVALVGIMLFGVITSYNDIKHNKIRNKWLLVALIFGITINLGAVAYLFYTNSEIRWLYLTQYFINILFSFFVGFLIWEASLWSAGDAKLFLVYATIVPLTIYRWGYVNNFPSFVLLINTFTPYFVFYFVFLLIKSSMADKLKVVKDMFNPKLLFSFIIFIFGFGWIVYLMYGIFNVQFNLFVTIFILFLIMIPLSKLPKLGLSGSGIILTILRFLFDKSIYSVVFLKQFLAILIIFIFARYFIINLGFKYFSKAVYIEDLKPGMILAEDIYKVKGKMEYKKRKLVPISFITPLFDRIQYKSLISKLPEGLTEEEVKTIKKFHSVGKFKSHAIGIYQTIPFSPFMFFGVLLTFIAQGNVLIAIRVLLERFI